MIIRDLEVLEVVSEEAKVEGGWYYYYPSANANANASALAVGYNTYTSTYTNTQAVSGVFSSSNSGSYSSAR